MDEITSDNYDLNISLQNNTDSLIAVQGPNSRQILNEILNINLDIKFYHLMQTQLYNDNVIISRTGYTASLAMKLWLIMILLENYGIF